jgi:hypothetical protein
MSGIGFVITFMAGDCPRHDPHRAPDLPHALTRRQKWTGALHKITNAVWHDPDDAKKGLLVAQLYIAQCKGEQEATVLPNIGDGQSPPTSAMLNVNDGTCVHEAEITSESVEQLCGVEPHCGGLKGRGKVMCARSSPVRVDLFIAHRVGLHHCERPLAH